MLSTSEIGLGILSLVLLALVVTLVVMYIRRRSGKHTPDNKHTPGPYDCKQDVTGINEGLVACASQWQIQPASGTSGTGPNDLAWYEKVVFGSPEVDAYHVQGLATKDQELPKPVQLEYSPQGLKLTMGTQVYDNLAFGSSGEISGNQFTMRNVPVPVI